MKQFNWLFENPIAHRGLHDDVIEENSLSAYQAAVDNNYAIEIDIYVLKDNNIAVFHDPFLSRICGDKGLIQFKDIQSLSKYKMTCGGEHIPLLDEVLALVDGKVPLLIEFKSFNRLSHRLEIEALKVLETYKYNNVALQSFNRSVVRYLLKHAPNYPVGQLASHKTAGIIHFTKDGVCHFSNNLRADFVAFNVKSMPNQVNLTQKATQIRPMLAWTVRTEEQYKIARRYVDNVIFEKIKPEKIDPASYPKFNK